MRRKGGRVKGKQEEKNGGEEEAAVACGYKPKSAQTYKVAYLFPIACVKEIASLPGRD